VFAPGRMVHVVAHGRLGFGMTGATSLDKAFCNPLWHSILVCLKFIINKAHSEVWSSVHSPFA